MTPGFSLVDVIRVGMQGGAVRSVAQGVEDVGIDAVLDVMDRAIGEHGVEAGRVGRAEYKPRVPIVRPVLDHVKVASGIGEVRNPRARRKYGPIRGRGPATCIRAVDSRARVVVVVAVEGVFV